MTTAPTSRLIRLIGKFLAPALFLAGYLVILIHWTGGSGATLTQSLASGLTAIGSLAGLTGAYLALTQFMLQSRLPLLETPFGRAGLVKVHKINGYAVIIILYIHASLVTFGYALANHVGYFKQYTTFLQYFPDVLSASIALVLFGAIVVTSITIVRRRLKYETWFYVHLITYLAILLAFGHQIAVGNDFSSASDESMRIYWRALYVFVFASVILFRFIRPVYRLLRFGFQVERVVPEAQGVTSIYITGRNLKKLKYVPGQFMIWRFLDKKRILQSHPFTISKAPDGVSLRLSAKAVGDYTSTLADVKTGTRVLIDGPYGDFTIQDDDSENLLFIAGGIGITPLRAMIEGLEPSRTAVLLYAVRTTKDIALRDELESYADAGRLKIHYVLSNEEVKGYAHGQLSAEMIQRLVPDFLDRSIYLCGPPPMIKGVNQTLLDIGVYQPNIHSERFAF